MKLSFFIIFVISSLTAIARPVGDPLSPMENPYLQPFGNSYLDNLLADPSKSRIATSFVKGQNGKTHKVSLPVRYWEVSGLGLYGIIDYKKVEAVLEAEAKKWNTPLRKAYKIPGTELGMLFIYSANLNGSDVGPVKDYFVNILLEPNSVEAAIKPVFVIYTWFFYQNGYLNHLWKNQYWGINTKLAQVGYDFREDSKQAVLAIPQGKGKKSREIMKMKWNLGKMSPRPKAVAFPEIAAVFVSHRKRVFAPFYYSGERLWDDSDAATGLSTFDKSRGDEFSFDPNTEVGRALKHLGFQPTSWIFFTNYSGNINFPIQPVY